MELLPQIIPFTERVQHGIQSIRGRVRDHLIHKEPLLAQELTTGATVLPGSSKNEEA